MTIQGETILHKWKIVVEYFSVFFSGAMSKINIKVKFKFKSKTSKKEKYGKNATIINGDDLSIYHSLAKV